MEYLFQILELICKKKIHKNKNAEVEKYSHH